MKCKGCDNMRCTCPVTKAQIRAAKALAAKDSDSGHAVLRDMAEQLNDMADRRAGEAK